MARYDYVCDKCKIITEIRWPIKQYDSINKSCPTCGETMERIYDVPSIRFKGSGFYSTDNPKKIDKKTADRMIAGEYNQLVNYAETQIEEEDEESNPGYITTDRLGKKHFIPDEGVEKVIQEGKQTRIKIRENYKRV